MEPVTRAVASRPRARRCSSRAREVREHDHGGDGHEHQPCDPRIDAQQDGDAAAGEDQAGGGVEDPIGHQPHHLDVVAQGGDDLADASRRLARIGPFQDMREQVAPQ